MAQEQAAEKAEIGPEAGVLEAETEVEGDAELEAAAAELEAAAAALGCAAEPIDGAFEEMDLEAIQVELDRGDSEKVDLDALTAELNAEQDSLVALAAQLEAADAVDAAAQARGSADFAATGSVARKTPPTVERTPERQPVFELKNLVWIQHPALRTQTKPPRQGGERHRAGRSSVIKKKKRQLRLAFKSC